jgi:hypothetical protein
MGRTVLTRFGRRHARVLALLTFAALAGAMSPAGPSAGDASKGNAAIRSSGGPFFRAAYGYRSTALAAARAGARYRVMILQQDDGRLIPRLKARNRDLKVLMYVDMMTSDPRDPTGVTNWAGYADARTNHRDWFLKDTNGEPLVWKDDTAAHLMDVGNTAYENAGAARVSKRANARGFDGVFLDNANASLRWVIAGGSAACVSYPTTAQWQAAVYAFFSNVAPRLHRAGLLVVANIGGSIITPGLWQKWNGPIDGAMEESFTNGGTGPDSTANGRWPAKLVHALWSEATGKISLDHAVTETRQGARYALATMLLAAHRKNLFSASSGYSQEVWWPEYATAKVLGSPIAAYRVLRNGVYRRDFKDGVVLVNPSLRATSRVRLGRAFSGSGLHQVTGVSLAPTSGIVLVKS